MNLNSWCNNTVHWTSLHIISINSLRPFVCDGARVHHRRPTGSSPALLDFSWPGPPWGVPGQVRHRRPAGSLVPCMGGTGTAVLWFPTWVVRARPFFGSQHGRSVAWRRSATLLQAREEEEEDRGTGQTREEKRNFDWSWQWIARTPGEKENLRRKSVEVTRSASNGFHGGLFKNNNFFKKKICFAPLCVCLLV